MGVTPEVGGVVAECIGSVLQMSTKGSNRAILSKNCSKWTHKSSKLSTGRSDTGRGTPHMSGAGHRIERFTIRDSKFSRPELDVIRIGQENGVGAAGRATRGCGVAGRSSMSTYELNVSGAVTHEDRSWWPQCCTPAHTAEVVVDKVEEKGTSAYDGSNRSS